MKNAKRISLSLGLLLLVVLVTGCVQFDVDLTLNKNNTGKMIIASAIDKDMEEAFGGEDGSTDMSQPIGIPEGLEGVDVKRTPLNYKVGKSTYEGEKVEISFKDTEKFLNELSKGEDQSLRIVDLPNGNKRVEVDLAQDSSTDEFDVYSIISEMGGRMKFTIKTDYNVVNHNATNVNNGLYTWNILELLMTNKDTKYFLEYSPEEKVVLPSLVGKSRAEVDNLMTSLGLSLQDKDFHGKALNKIGLLLGTGNGLELDKVLTRAEGASMYVRLLGVQDEIEKFARENPNYISGFTDVPTWVKPTIDYLHNRGLVAGISTTLYGSNNTMTPNDYTTFVLRALGYNDSKGEFSWSEAVKKSEELGLYLDDKVKPQAVLVPDLPRKGASYITYNALFFKHSKTGERLIDKLNPLP